MKELTQSRLKELLNYDPEIRAFESDLDRLRDGNPCLSIIRLGQFNKAEEFYAAIGGPPNLKGGCRERLTIEEPIPKSSWLVLLFYTEEERSAFEESVPNDAKHLIKTNDFAIGSINSITESAPLLYKLIDEYEGL